MIKHKENASAHLFAFHTPSLKQIAQTLAPGQLIHFKDVELWHRIERVLRLKPQDAFILFDQHQHIECILRPETAEKKHIISAAISVVKQNEIPAPRITLGIGLVKRPTLHEIMYAATQMGVSSVIPLLTEKSQREWGGEKEYEKLHKTAIGAAEQSKNYVLPSMEKPLTVAEFIAQTRAKTVTSKLLYFEQGGLSFFQALADIHTTAYEEIVVVIGSEGGLTLSEQQLFDEGSYQKLALTPHVLRSIDAVVVALGAIRCSA